MTNDRGGGSKAPQPDDSHRKIPGDLVRVSGINGVVTVKKSSEDVQAEEGAAVEVRAREQRRERREIWKFWIDVATLFLATLAAIAAFAQLATLREQFVKDERPFVLCDDVQLGPRIGAHGEPESAFDILLENFGKSPALNVGVAADYFYGPNAEARARQYLKNLPARPDKPSAMTIPPNTSKEHGGFHVTLIVPALDMIGMVTTRTKLVLIVDRVGFDDVSGNPYTQDECRVFDADAKKSYICPPNVLRP